MTDFTLARHNMVESQVRPNDVTDLRIQAAMRGLPRERFVPKAKRAVAYSEADIAIADNRFLLQARDFSKLVEAADVTEHDIVLDIGCGTGYSSAVLASLASMVVALECDDQLAAQATDLLNELEIENAVVIQGDLTAGVPKQAPFDIIFINGGVEEIPTALFDQLRDGGRLVAIAEHDGAGSAVVFKKSGDAIGERPVFDAAAPLLPGFEAAKKFVF